MRDTARVITPATSADSRFRQGIIRKRSRRFWGFDLPKVDSGADTSV